MPCCSGTEMTSRKLQFTYFLSSFIHTAAGRGEKPSALGSSLLRGGFSKRTSARRGGVRELGAEGDPSAGHSPPTGGSPVDLAQRRRSWLPCYEQGPSAAPKEVVKQACRLPPQGARAEDWRGAVVQAPGPGWPQGPHTGSKAGPAGAERLWGSWVQGQGRRGPGQAVQGRSGPPGLQGRARRALTNLRTRTRVAANNSKRQEASVHNAISAVAREQSRFPKTKSQAYSLELEKPIGKYLKSHTWMVTAFSLAMKNDS